MILYFADRQLNIIETASTELNGIRVVEDSKKETIETGSKVFECTVLTDNKEACMSGNFLLRSADDGNEFYTIIESEFDAEEGVVYIYAEDAGLDMINVQVPENTFTAKTLQYCIDYYLTNYADGWEIGLDESTTDTMDLEYTDTTTLTERLLSIASSFGYELAFSYAVEGLNVTHKYVDLYKERGNKNAQQNLYIGRQIKNIKPKNSVADLATALEVTGETPKGSKKPINLSGADYSSDGETTHSPAVSSDDYQISGTRVVCQSAISKWKSAIDDGVMIRPYNFDTTNKQKLFTKAVEELKKLKDRALTYEVDFNYLDAKLGDWVNVIDDKDEIYVTARILELNISVTSDTQSAVLGEFIVRTSGISDRLLQLAEELKKQVLDATNIEIASSNGIVFANTAISTTLTATVYYGDVVIMNQTDLENVFGSAAAVKWYNAGVLIDTGFTTNISSANASETITAKVET